MKSILEGPKKGYKKEQKYPCLMINPQSGNVFLITGMAVSGTEGTLIHSAKKTHPIGICSAIWNADYLEPLEGTITLSN